MTNPPASIAPTEIRKDPLLERWVIFAPARASRPEILSQDSGVTYDPKANPFCAGQEVQTPGELYALSEQAREKNSPGWDVRVFPNAFPALQQAGIPERFNQDQFTWMKGIGHHELIVDCPQYEADFGNLPPAQLAKVLTAYRDRMEVAYAHPEVEYVQVFKNQGAAAGASLPHAHSQLLTFPMQPPLIQEEIAGCVTFCESNQGQFFFPWLINKELSHNKRVILNTPQFIVLAPYASRFAFEAWVIPHQHHCAYTSITKDEIDQLSKVVSRVLHRLSQLIKPAAYNLVLHSVPKGVPNSNTFCWHLEILPRITGLAGFEMGTGCYVNPVYPEQAVTQYGLK